LLYPLKNSGKTGNGKTEKNEKQENCFCTLQNCVIGSRFILDAARIVIFLKFASVSNHWLRYSSAMLFLWSGVSLVVERVSGAV